ncbi:hypothetical protein F5Y07DRAFT_406068 [Xylaria sp. FL0933]|nr:hypothetical protein F5Y07DRAFT_406068 [Xylaria sp. FL0933]
MVAPPDYAKFLTEMTDFLKEVSTDNEPNMLYHLHRVKQRLNAADLTFDTIQVALQERRENYKRGLLDTTRDRFKAETQRLEERASNLLVQKIHMRTSTYELAGKELDVERWGKRAHAEDWSYIDSLGSPLKEPSGRNPDRQARWRKAVMEAYGAKTGVGKEAWCPITQRYSSMITAAHIVRCDVREPAAVHLFGFTDNPEGHIWDTRNGISLVPPYAEMLDDAEIAIVPTNDGKDLMVIVLDEDERVREPDPDSLIPTGRALHGRILKFKTDHRPSMRYLYFAFVINLLRREKFSVHGWRRYRIEYPNMPYFRAPENWIRMTTLRKLAIKMGHMPAQEADEFISMIKGIRLEDPSLEIKNKEEEEDDDDDDREDEEEMDEVFTSILQYIFIRTNLSAPHKQNKTNKALLTDFN